MDLKTTKFFVENYPDFDKCLVQIFDDVETRKDKTLAREALRRSEETKKLCETMNSKGCGIFFSVNQITEDKRRAVNVTGINARFTEIDHISKEEQMKLIQLSPLQPSLVVESKRGYQIYFLAEGGTKERRKEIMRGVRNFFEGDHKVITIERVLRIPGFDHCKNPDDRFEVVYRPMSMNKYTEEDMLKAFPDTVDRQEQAKKLKEQKKRLEDQDDGFWKRASSVNSEYMLSILSGTKRVNGESIEIRQGQIFVNGKSTSSWIDSKGMIGSHDKGGPTWVQWITWYGRVDRKELYEWLIDKFPELKPKQEKKASKVEEVEADDFFVEYDREHKTDYQTVVPFTFGNNSLDEYFGRIEYGRFITTVGESGSGKTTWAFHQGIEISRNYKVLFISLEMTGERVIELRARKMSGITHKEWDDKLIPDRKIQKMEEYKKEITQNKNLQIVGVNKNANGIDVDSIIKAITAKYMEYDRIIIDNLGFITGKEAEDEYKELNYIIRSFKSFCHDNNKNINLLHHFNKGNSKARKDRDRTFADVLGTGKLEHDVDYGIFISRYLDNRDEMTEEQKQEVFIKIAKDRDHGEIKKKTIYFYKGRYYDIFQPTM